MQIDARHAQCMAMICSGLMVRGYELALDYRHSSLLPQLRATQLTAALQSRASLAVFCDGDCWPDAMESFMTSLTAWHTSSSGYALVGGIAPQRDGRVNAWSEMGVRIPAAPIGIVDVWAIGFGLVVWDLRIVRELRTRGLRTSAMFRVATEGGDDDAPSYMSEDVRACRELARCGGKIGAKDWQVQHAGGF